MLQRVISDGEHFRRSLQHEVLKVCWGQARLSATAALSVFQIPLARKVEVLLGKDGAAKQAFFIHALNLAVMSSRVRAVLY